MASVGTINNRERLRQFADDCEERARRSRNETARSLYLLAARECRLAMTAHDGRGRETLEAMRAQAGLARWYDGEGASESVTDSLEGFWDWCPPAAISGAGETPVAPVEAMPVRRPEQLLNARQLADRYGVSERGARKTIERGFRRGLIGFHRDGRLLFAEPDAFARLIQH